MNKPTTPEEVAKRREAQELRTQAYEEETDARAALDADERGGK